MRNIGNWDDIQERRPGEHDRPAPGGYIARIVRVEDDEKKEYLRIEWDFDEGEHKGNNAGTFDRAGFWPIALYRSYKHTALGFFKAFKTSVEMSNKGYAFDCARPEALEGKLMGVVLGEEEYIKKDQTVGKRLYVYCVRSVKAIRDGDFDIPALKRLAAGQAPAAYPPTGQQFQAVEALEDEDDLPF